MKISGISKFIIVITLSIIPTACNVNKAGNIVQNTANTANNTTNQPQNITYGDLIVQKSSDYIIIPAHLPDPKENTNSGINLSRSYKQRKQKIIHNLVFYNRKTGDSHLLLNKKAIIQSYQTLEIKPKDKPKKEFWIYQIIDKDTNQNNQFDSQDATIIYISDLSGKNFQQITPNNTKLINWVILAKENSILIKIIKDSNEDQKFTSRDDNTFIRVNLDKPEIGKEIISQELEVKMRSYMTK